MANETFWLVFSEEPTIKYDINEPIGYGSVDFNLDRKDGGHALDVSLSGGKVNFRFTLYRHDGVFQKLLEYNEIKGFEASVLLHIKLENGTVFIGELDFYTATTNDFDYFECSVILQSEMQIFKRRFETKVDLFSDRDINGNPIEPLQPINMLLQAKPSIQESKWKQISPTTVSNLNLSRYFSLTQSIDGQGGINSTLLPLIGDTTIDAGKPFQILEADDNLNDVKMNIRNMNIHIFSNPENSSLRARIYYLKANSYPTGFNPIAGATLLYDNGGIDFTIQGDLPEISLGNFQRGEKLWLFLLVTQYLAYDVTVTTTSVDTQITVESTAYNSVFPVFRLIDVMRQVTKSISGLGIFAPRYDLGSELHDTVLTNGNLLRNIQNKPFYISWEDIEKSIIGENNADSMLKPNKQVLVAIEEDFYTNEECGFFDNTQFSGLKKNKNPEYALNKFSLKYNKYQSLKETAEPNSESTIHGESQLTPYNQKVENKKEISIEWVRDAIFLDVQQRLSTKVSTDTATQDDDTIFAIDTVSTLEDQMFTETTELQHTFTGVVLSLRNKGDINFIILGIRNNTNFTIESPDGNAGNYIVISVTSTELLLQKIIGSNSSASDGIRFTKYTYEIKQETAPLTNRTNQGFNYVLNLLSPSKYSNLRFSVERNIRNYWNSFLATVNLYWADKPLKNTYYKNNGLCKTEYNGLRITEKEDFIPTNPIVTPNIYEDVIFANVEFSDVLTLYDQLRQRLGFIRTIDNNRRVLKLFPLKMSYTNKTKQLTISGKEKFEKSYLDITRDGTIITINGETKVLSLIYEVEEGNKIVLFDIEKEKLYNGIIWNKVSVNGEIAETLNILKSWLDLLK